MHELPPGPGVVRLLARRLLGMAGWTAIGVGVGLALAVFAPALFGYRSFTVLSGSMTPTLGVGDAIVDRPLPAEQIRPGDVITFPDPNRHERLITHRVRRAWIHGTTVEVTTRGDANNVAEQWSIRTGERVGRVVYRLPKIGYVLVWARGTWGRLALVVLPALGLGLLGVQAIWRPRSRARTG